MSSPPLGRDPSRAGFNPAPPPPTSKALRDQAVRPVERPVPLRETVYEAILELILHGSLTPGQRLVEAELAGALGVSRQPVREAFHRLHTQGYVDLVPSIGALVHVPTEQEVVDLLDVRSLLAAECARLAAERSSPEMVAGLRGIWRDGVAALDSGDLEAVVLANAALHEEITELAGNAVLTELASLVERRMRWYYRPVALVRGGDAWHEHAEIIDAIEARDSARAVEVMRRHTGHTKEAYKAKVAEQR